MSKHALLLIISFILLMTAQVFIFRNFVVFQVGFSFVYLLFLLSLPSEAGFTGGMVLALISALIVDLFSQTLGIHASAAVFIMFIRPFWMGIILPRSGYEVNDLMILNNYGVQWFLAYAAPLIFSYCCIVFFIEAGSAQFFWHTITKALVSTVVTLVFVVFTQYLFYPKSS
ncbi:Rod shape-determining protein MreD [Roseivirga sp.]|uniref:Rod shape-determining protein MreD n=1 Tax=Roseivirga sp. TaxID=1964215 RepID=UPI003B5155BD